MKRPARVPSQLPASLHHRLNAYALAASAAGMGVLALAQPAEAKIIYTPAHQRIFPFARTPWDGSFIGKFSLDLNHDGVADFQFIDAWYGNFGYLRVESALGFSYNNQIWGAGSPSASALAPGVRVGPNGKFDRGHVVMAGWAYVFGSGSWSYGKWVNVKDRYLGLQFLVGKKVHYGWARLSVKVTKHGPGSATLTGYAYETIPNKPIITGKTHGKDEATLGRLAQGASGISDRGKP